MPPVPVMSLNSGPSSDSVCRCRLPVLARMNASHADSRGGRRPHAARRQAQSIQNTVRGIPPAVDSALRKKAAQRKHGLNQCIVDELTMATGWRRPCADFSDLVGRCTPPSVFEGCQTYNERLLRICLASEMYRRQFSDDKTRRRLQRLDHRLLAITQQLQNIAAPEK